MKECDLESLNARSPVLVSDDAELHFGAERGVELNGERFTPDETKGYVKFRLCHSFPVITAYNSSFYAGTVGNSFPSMLHQNFNVNHLLAHYYKGSKKDQREDRICGAIVGVDYPRAPSGGWKLSQVLKDKPGITAVSTIFKHAKGVDKIIGQHQGGRHNWAVSVEVNFKLTESGVVFGKLNDDAKDFKGDLLEAATAYTPADFSDAGYHYIPTLETPEEVFQMCWDEKLAMFTKPYKSWRPTLILGGLSGRNHYKGVGIVEHGAEPTARIEEMLARHPDGFEWAGGLTEMHRILGEMMEAVGK